MLMLVMQRRRRRSSRRVRCEEAEEEEEREAEEYRDEYEEIDTKFKSRIEMNNKTTTSINHQKEGERKKE